MIKSILTLMVISLININIYAQQYLLVADSKELILINYDSKVEWDCYQCWRFNEKIKLSDIYGFNLAGYNWQSDSLIISLEQAGKISKLYFHIDTLQNLIPDKIKFKVQNAEALFRPTNDPIVIYSFDNLKITSQSGGEMKCYYDSLFLWEKKCNVKTFSCVIVGGGCWNPILSTDKKTLLMKASGKLIEVDINSGKETLISKNGASNYLYSPNNNYISYLYNGQIYIYDKAKKKVNIYQGWKQAFWVFK